MAPGTPWDYIQPRDTAMMGEAIRDPEEQARWARAVFLAGTLPYVWAEAREFKAMALAAMNLAPGQKVLCVGEAMAQCGFLAEIEARVQPGGEVKAHELHDEARRLLAAGDRPQWPFTQSRAYDDGYFDRVIVPQGVHHCTDWQAAAPDFARVLQPGGLLVMVDARFDVSFQVAIRSHAYLAAIFAKILPHLGDLQHRWIDHPPDVLRDAFAPHLDGIRWVDYCGLLLLHGTRKGGTGSD